MMIPRSMVVPDKRSYKYTIPLPLPLRMLQKPDGGLTVLLANESKLVLAAKPGCSLTELLALSGCSPCSMQSTVTRAPKNPTAVLGYYLHFQAARPCSLQQTRSCLRAPQNPTVAFDTYNQQGYCRVAGLRLPPNPTAASDTCSVQAAVGLLLQGCIE